MRVVRRLVHALVIVLTLIIGAAAAAIIVSQTAWFKNLIRAYIVREANLYLNGTLSIERLSGNVLFGLEMENVAVSMDGANIVTLKDFGLDYNIWDFVTKGLSVDNIRLDKPVVYLRREGDTWSLSRLIKKEEWEANRSGPGRPISIEAIGVSDGSLVVEGPVGTSGVEVPKRFDHLDAKLSFKYEPVHYSIGITHLSFRGSEPAIALNTLSGGVAVKDDGVYVDKLAIRTAETSLLVDGDVRQYLSRPVFNLHVSSDKLSVPELAHILPALAGVRLQPQFDVKVAGPADRLGVELNVQSSAGQLTGKVVADVEAPGQSVTGDVSVRHLDLAPLLNNRRQKSDITGDARVDLHGESLTDIRGVRGNIQFDAPHVAVAGYAADRLHGAAKLEGRRVAIDARGAAYGATADAKGHVLLPQGRDALAYDLTGTARHVDLRRLPREVNVPRAATNVSAQYHAVGSVRHTTNVDLRFEPTTLAGARVAKGSTAAVTLNNGAVAYKTDANVSDLDLQRFGEAFNIPALANDRYRSSINGHITASGRGTTAEQLDLTAGGTLNESAILGGRVSRLAFEATVAQQKAHVKAAGDFTDFDPARLSGKPQLEGRVAGDLDVDATITNISGGVTADNVEVRARVNLLPSRIGGVDITRATADGEYRDSTGDIRTLEVAGRDLNVKASGTLALNEAGASKLTVHADSPNLVEAGKLVNQPLAGIATLDATVTGNKRELQATGHVVGDGVKYGDNGALTVSSDYTVKVPELSLADAAVTAKTRATFVTLGGQNINEVDGTTTYRQKQLDFDLTAKQPQRSLAAAGSMLMHPDHQEVHLQTLGLQTSGTTWQLAPGSSATVNYANDDLRVGDLKLVSGNQEITADGAFGRPGDALKVTLANVDLASVDALLLREPQLTGRLNATATIQATSHDGSNAAATLATGLKRIPEVDANFQVTEGAFRQFHYDTFGGTVHYRGKGMTVDARLQQNPTTFITAKGYLPTAVFNPVSAEARETAHGGAVAAEDRVDLHIESTPIDLGLVQGFTTQLKNVTGTFQAKVDVTGSAADPHPTGVVTLQKGAFLVVPTGVAYNNVEGKIDLEPDRVRVGAISALDNHFNPITISGDLAVHERQVGGVQVYIHTDDFKVIDNKMGNVRVNTDLQVAGELRAPRLEGDLGVTTGTINLDPILAEVGESAYSTTPTEYTAGAAGTNGQVPDALDLMNAFTGLTMNVHLTVPDDLVVKGAALETPDTPIGLGAITLTLGGDLRATKNQGGDIALVGLINTIRGTYTFQGRKFDILRDGTVRFTGEPLRDMDPLLDVRTRRVIQGVEARVNVRGTLKKPEIVLASTPTLEQADIMSLIVFNQPINQLGEGQQIAVTQRAAQLAGGAVVGALGESIAEALNLDTFDISIAPDSGNVAQVTVGQQVGPNLFVRVEQGLGDQSQTNFVLEYELTRWLRLQTNVVQGSSTQQQLFQRAQGSGVDLLFFFSY